VDDTHTIVYWYNTSPRKPGAPRQDAIPVRTREHIRLDGSLVADSVPAQDMLAWVAHGPISDRSTEHLATSDRGILLYRQVLWEQVERMHRGEDPLGVVRDPAKNEPWITIARERARLQPFHPGNDRGFPVDALVG
jgi:5,5'-dehydrodivanillate O-demethylase